MQRTSAGILLWRLTPAGPEVFVGHMGGPFWRKRPRAWSIPKGEPVEGEEPLEAALREFAEEIGVPAPNAAYRDLGTVRQAAGKVVTVFAARWDGPLTFVGSNTVRMEYPRGSGRTIEFPEIDEARWVTLSDARELLVAGQVAALDRLRLDALGCDGGRAGAIDGGADSPHGAGTPRNDRA